MAEVSCCGAGALDVCAWLVAFCPRGLKPGAGDPSGVVPVSEVSGLDIRVMEGKTLLLGGGWLRRSLNKDSIEAGNVFDRSQISINFLIFA